MPSQTRAEEIKQELNAQNYEQPQGQPQVSPQQPTNIIQIKDDGSYRKGGITRAWRNSRESIDKAVAIWNMVIEHGNTELMWQELKTKCNIETRMVVYTIYTTQQYRNYAIKAQQHGIAQPKKPNGIDKFWARLSN